VKSTVGELLDIFLGLQALAQQLEKVAPATRFRMGILLGRLRPVAVAYDRAHSEAVRRITNDNEGMHQNVGVMNSIMTEEIAKLREQEHEVAVGRLTYGELKMEENPKVGALALSQVMPIIDGIPDDWK